MTTVNAATKAAQLRITRRSPAYWRVTINNPPINVMGPEMVRQFQEVIDAIEDDEHVRVVVFDSAVDGYFLNHSELGAGWDACIASLERPAAQNGIKALMERGFHKPGDVENRLGYYLGQIGGKPHVK